jgi:hypothetical protein
MDLKGIGLRMWAGFIWLRIGTSGGLLYTRVYPNVSGLTTK